MDTRGPRARTHGPRQAAALLVIAALAGPLDAAWVIISEIHYAPPPRRAPRVHRDLDR